MRVFSAAGSEAPGRWTIAWDGRDDEGRRVGAGVYFARLHSRTRTVITRIAVIE